jgi:hypothetical protein
MTLLIAEAAESAGVHAEDPREWLLRNGSSAFDERAGADLIGDVFGQVEITLLDSALVFNRTDPVLAYFDSTRPLRGVDDRLWDRVRASLASLLGQRGPIEGGTFGREAGCESLSQSKHGVAVRGRRAAHRQRGCRVVKSHPSQCSQTSHRLMVRAESRDIGAIIAQRRLADRLRVWPRP